MSLLSSHLRSLFRITILGGDKKKESTKEGFVFEGKEFKLDANSTDTSSGDESSGSDEVPP
jgi:hypothetical protein